MLWLDRLRATLATLRYPAAWSLPPRLARTMRAALRELRPVRSDVGIVLHPYAPPIGGVAFGRYLRGLKRLARGEHVPLVVHLAVTDRCDNACRRCSNLPRSRRDPALDSLVPLLDGLRAAGTVSVALTGGEPRLRDDLPELIAACGPDISTTLFTTGRGLDGPAARRLRAAGLQMVFVSLDHDRAEPHDHQRGRPGAFAEAVTALRACRDAGLYTAAQAVVEAELLEPGALERYLDFCRGLGVHEVMLLEPVAVRGPDAAPPPPPAVRARLAALHARSARDARRLKVSAMPFLESQDFLGCQAGYSFLYIAASGDVFPCDFAPLAIGNVYQEPLADILARLARLFPAPACRCLAQELNLTFGAEQPRPLDRRQACEFLERRPPDRPPRLLDWC